MRKDADGVRNSIGVIPQALTSDPELTAEENLLIHAKLYGVPAGRRPALIRDLLEAVDLTRIRQGAGRHVFGRHAAAPGNRARTGAFAEDSFSRRADDRASIRSRARTSGK